jgi:hypothetical protein
MKKLLMGSVALTLFSTSILLFQISCKKEVNAQTNSGLVQQNLITYAKGIRSGTNTSNTYTYDVWLANLDGTNQRKIPINIPQAVGITGAKITPDGKTIVFEAHFDTTIGGNSIRYADIYSCSIDGSNVKKIITSSITDAYNYQKITLDGAY